MSSTLSGSLCQSIALFFGVATRTVQRWFSSSKFTTASELLAVVAAVQKPSAPVLARLDSPDILAELCALFGEDPPGATLPPGQPKETGTDNNSKRMELQEARLRKLRLEAERIQLDLEKTRRDVVLRADIRENGVAIGSWLSAEVAALRSDLPGRLVGLDVIAIGEQLQARLDAMLLSFQAKLTNASR